MHLSCMKEEDSNIIAEKNYMCETSSGRPQSSVVLVNYNFN